MIDVGKVRLNRWAWIAIAVGAAVVVFIATGGLQVVTTQLDRVLEGSDEMNPPTFKSMERYARSIIGGLNARKPESMYMLDSGLSDPNRDAYDARLDRNIEAAMPLPGCHYTLDSVRDRGFYNEPADVLGSAVSKYRFDMLIQEICPDKKPIQRVIGVIEVPYMSEWTAAMLIIEM